MALSWRRRRGTPSPLSPPPTSSSTSPPPLSPLSAAPPSTSTLSPTSFSSSSIPRNALAFWLLGLANNSPYTIALAAANELAAGAVGSVFFAAVFPALLLKLTTPFWFPRVPVNVRAAVAALMALVAFPLLAAATRGKEEGGEKVVGGNATRTSSVLASIALLSCQGGLGEASALAAAGSYPRPRALLGAWSSGTGAAGPVGFSFLILFHVFAKLSLRLTMLLALFWPLLWLVSHFVILKAPPRPDAAAAAADGAVIVIGGGGRGGAGTAAAAAAAAAAIELSPRSLSRPLSAAAAAAATKAALDPEEAAGLLTLRSTQEEEEEEEEEGGGGGGGGGEGEEEEGDEERGRKTKAEEGTAAVAGTAAASAAAAAAPPPSSFSPASSGSPRWAATALPSGFLATSAHVVSLWPFAVPLFLVYFAEYVCQAGVWSALGGADPQKRDRFYKSANWLYQAGVFLSRTFGGFLRLSRGQLWLLPLAQAVLLALFLAAAASSKGWIDLAPHLLPFPLLLIPAFVVGLFGGLGYVSTFALLADSVPFPPLRQLSLAAVSVADSAGIALADAVSVLVQGCLYRASAIPGAAFRCGWEAG